MPRFRCDKCDKRKDYSVDELVGKVRLECPNGHGSMRYWGRIIPPWHQGHALSSLFLTLLLFGVLVVGAANVQDRSEAGVTLIVGLVLAVFEIGRLSAGPESTLRFLSIGQVRLTVFFLSTIVIMSITQNKMDGDESRMLWVLAGVTLCWHVISYLLDWGRGKETPKRLAFELFKSALVGAVVVFFGNEIEIVGEVVDGLRHYSEDGLVFIAELLRPNLDS